METWRWLDDNRPVNPVERRFLEKLYWRYPRDFAVVRKACRTVRNIRSVVA